MIDLLATDYDRTLTSPSLRLHPRTVDALAQARRRGLRVVVVSGRAHEFLMDRLAGVADGIVSENGAFAWMKGDAAPRATFGGDFPQAMLRKSGLPFAFARAMASIPIEHEDAALRFVRARGLAVRPERNREHLMLLPPGVDKGAGLSRLLRRMRVPASRVAVAGDAENDLALFGAGGMRIAVANAVPELKALADVVTRAPGGAGVREWLEEWAALHGPARGAFGKLARAP